MHLAFSRRRRRRVTLKINRSTSTKGVVFALSGEMQGDELADLVLLLEGATPGRVALDLGDVTLVDRKAVDFIRIAVAAGDDPPDGSAHNSPCIDAPREKPA